MASFVKEDGTVVPPLNISAPAPLINLRGFSWGTVDAVINGLQIEQNILANKAAQDKEQPPTQTQDVSAPPSQDEGTPPSQDAHTPPPQDDETPPSQDILAPPPQDNKTPQSQDVTTAALSETHASTGNSGQVDRPPQDDEQPVTQDVFAAAQPETSARRGPAGPGGPRAPGAPGAPGGSGAPGRPGLGGPIVAPQPTTLPAPQLPVFPDGVGFQLPMQLGPHKDSPPPIFPLAQFQGAYAGNGFNLIFRPRPKKDPTDFPVTPVVNGPDDNVLELNLTTEQLTFGRTIGGIPNRGLSLNNQDNITLGGLPYLQTIQDVTNPITGRGDRADPVDIHFEPGMWLNVPATSSPANKASVVRMASIPHGTTINAQCFSPPQAKTALGGESKVPTFPVLDTTPFPIGNINNKIPFASQNADQIDSPRIPQDLRPFIAAGTITTDIIKNPNLVLQRAIQGLNIRETITFEVSTGATVPNDATMNGGGTANISFLAGTQATITTLPPDGAKGTPNAHAAVMTARFWIETVAYQVNVPRITTKSTLLLRPIMSVNSTAPTPVFAISSPPKLPSEAQKITVPGIQIQYSQSVNLNFATLTWPHVSVATLVPSNPQPFTMTS